MATNENKSDDLPAPLLLPPPAAASVIIPTTQSSAAQAYLPNPNHPYLFPPAMAMWAQANNNNPHDKLLSDLWEMNLVRRKFAAAAGLPLAILAPPTSALPPVSSSSSSSTCGFPKSIHPTVVKHHRSSPKDDDDGSTSTLTSPTDDDDDDDDKVTKETKHAKNQNNDNNDNNNNPHNQATPPSGRFLHHQSQHYNHSRMPHLSPLHPSYAPGIIPNFWECINCRSLPLKQRHKHSVIYSFGCAPNENEVFAKRHLESCRAAAAAGGGGGGGEMLPRRGRCETKRKRGVRTVSSSSSRTSDSENEMNDDDEEEEDDDDDDEATMTPRRRSIILPNPLIVPTDSHRTTSFDILLLSQYHPNSDSPPGLFCQWCPVVQPNNDDDNNATTKTTSPRTFYFSGIDSILNNFTHLEKHTKCYCRGVPRDIKRKLEELGGKVQRDERVRMKRRLQMSRRGAAAADGGATVGGSVSRRAFVELIWERMMERI